MTDDFLNYNKNGIGSQLILNKCYEGGKSVTEKKENPQKTLSKELLRQALLDLMKEKPYKQISITELTMQADLARRTFYRHFITIDDVLDYHIQMICNEMVVMFLEEEKKDFQILVVLYFKFWEGYKEFLLILKKNDLLFMLLQKTMAGIRQKLSEITNKTSCPISREYSFYFTAGGLWNLMVKWIEDGTKLSPEEMGYISKNIMDNL